MENINQEPSPVSTGGQQRKEIENINPSDTRDCIGMYAQASTVLTSIARSSRPQGPKKRGNAAVSSTATRCRWRSARNS